MKIKDLSYLESVSSTDVNGGLFSSATASTVTVSGFATTRASSSVSTSPWKTTAKSQGSALAVSFGGFALASSSSVSAS